MAIIDDEFNNMSLNEKVRIIFSYLSLTSLTDLQIQRINYYIEAYRETVSEYAATSNDDKEIESRLKLLTTPMYAAESLYNDGEIHPAVDMLINSEKMESISFDKSYQRTRKNSNIPSIIPDDFPYQKAGYGISMIILLICAGLSIFLAWFYYILKTKAGL